MEQIIICTIKDWNIKKFYKIKEDLKNSFEFHLIDSKDKLSYEFIKKINPKYIFFPHWSWIIPENIHKNFECILFHMTDLPFGRGGSPMQNLIINKIYKTKISAIKVTKNIDEGDIYIKEPLDISIGSAEENFIKMSNIIFDVMIPEILKNSPIAVKQSGNITYFKRRTKEQSDIKSIENLSLNKLYDFIRMLDADGYPKAYIKLDKLKIEFSEVHFKSDKLTGRFEVKYEK